MPFHSAVQRESGEVSLMLDTVVFVSLDRFPPHVRTEGNPSRPLEIPRRRGFLLSKMSR